MVKNYFSFHFIKYFLRENVEIKVMEPSKVNILPYAPQVVFERICETFNFNFT